MTTNRAVLGLVPNKVQAGNVVADLRLNGFPVDVISVVFPDEVAMRGRSSGEYERSEDKTVVIGPGMGIGRFGGALGFLGRVVSFTVPDGGAFVAAGPILAALSSAVTGATSVATGLANLGLSQHDASHIENKLYQGHILVTVHVEHSLARSAAKKLLERYGATDIATAGHQPAASRAA